MPVMKTPGVYIVEKNAFANSVVEVATAVPAFIGYTARADDRGKPLKLTPKRISSMAEFVQYFGGPPQASFEIRQAKADEDASFRQKDKGYVLDQKTGRFNLYYGMLQFFKNGGGPCWIVSVGLYGEAAEAGAAAPAPTPTPPAPAPADAPATGATDAPAPPPPAPPAPDASAGLKTQVSKGDLELGIPPLLLEQEPTMLVMPDAVLLSNGECYDIQQAMLKHCGLEMRNRVAVLDVHGGDQRGDQVISDFRTGIGINQLDFGAAYYPFVHTTTVGERDVDYGRIGNTDLLIQLISADLELPAQPSPPTEPKLKLQFDKLQDIKKTWTPPAGLKDEEAKAWVRNNRELLNSALRSMSPLFRTILDEIRNKLNLMPPSPAMAGLYCMVDNTRGVWKAPANVSINGVVRPAVNISTADQADLNVHTTGKSINAIRSFIGEGVLVWGARTLNGNSLDWRYINVRRTMIMLEESCRLAAKAMVFEPNVGSTWVTIRSMISNFLTGIWKRGGLAGATPEDAFSVHVGLGETMTPEDILEGILRVTVLVAVSRPAEFIEITFQQQMQKS